MSDLRELSKLPADQAYWDQLAATIVGDVFRTPKPWWHGLEGRAVSLLGLAAAAAIAAIMLLPAREMQRDASAAALLQLSSADPLAEQLLKSDAPPAVISLILPVGPND